MKLTAVAVSSKNIPKTVEFYQLLGFEFGKFSPSDDHVEPITQDGSARLMIDSAKLTKELTGSEPKAANHSIFALEYESPDEVDDVAKKVKEAGFKLTTEPWDAFWGQRYAVVQDPDGYKVDLYAYLPKK